MKGVTREDSARVRLESEKRKCIIHLFHMFPIHPHLSNESDLRYSSHHRVLKPFHSFRFFRYYRETLSIAFTSNCDVVISCYLFSYSYLNECLAPLIAMSYALNTHECNAVTPWLVHASPVRPSKHESDSTSSQTSEPHVRYACVGACTYIRTLHLSA